MLMSSGLNEFEATSHRVKFHVVGPAVFDHVERDSA